jgi:hypothetical protein
MKKTAGLVVVAIFVAAGISGDALAQIRLQPTPAPTVTAETETWYQTGEPLLFAGNVYYPAGPAIHFLPNEMVQSGLYRGIPLYSRTTIEPYSVVFVPLAGGRMQPYERRRAGDLVGTTGSSVPSLPVEIPSAFGTPPPIQAAAPPFVETQSVLQQPTAVQDQLRGSNSTDSSTRSRRETNVEPLVQMAGRQTNSPRVGTVGRVSASRRSNERANRSIANGIFVEFDHARWYPSAPPASLDSVRLDRIGEWHGFPVYTAHNTGASTIYIPIAEGVDAYAAYSRRR